MPRPALRVEKIPPYLFARIDKKKTEARNKGIDLIDLGVGDPDIPTPAHIVSKMQEAVANPKHHQYPSYEGMPAFRKAVAEWYLKRFGVTLDPDKEVVTLIGSKEGIAHLPWAYLEEGDVALIPSPGYPVYKITTLLAGGTPYIMPLREENGFQPVLETIPRDVRQKAKIAFLNYPNNPTGAHADDNLYEKALDMARQDDILICHDAAYSEVTYDGYTAKSILEFDKDKRYSIEFHSLSKTYCMTGWRIGFAVGNADAVQNLGKLKTNIDSGAFQAIQEAGIEALTGNQDSIGDMKRIFARRRDVVVDGLSALGIKVRKPLATFYIWAHVPQGYTSADFAEKLIEEKGVVVTPGSGFGEEGEGYFRISITAPEDRIREAMERLKSLKL
ncbi:MAG: LL-diaminopimelate aminotransferase [Syntrophorhabdaceae bacterium PtaU1.Bin034]|nr:MAG: LL-diaminopimelate aminotransferase [Syntrophorhabdaceae bacterium PtaU1.Bin034]